MLIVAGDLTAHDAVEEYSEFQRWLVKQRYRKKILIAGNHDTKLESPWPGGLKGPFREDKAFYDFDYLCDSGTEFEGLKIWGSPWTPLFKGINPFCKAFMLPEAELAAKFAMIPDDTDILVTHGPPYGVFDGVVNNIPMKNGVMKKIVKQAGSLSLDDRVSDIKPRLHVFGHIHEGYGRDLIGDVEFINCSHVNERYEPVNKPIRIIL